MKKMRLYGCMVFLFMPFYFTVAQDLTALPGWQIRPYNTFLRTGKSTTLGVKFCQPTDMGKDDLTPLVSVCDDNDLNPLIDQSTVTDWSVNGVPGGNAQWGTIKAADYGEAQYTAPSKKPATETVQVSAVVHPANTTEKILIVASITILENEKVYFGTVNVHGSFEGLHCLAVGTLGLKEAEPNSEIFHSVAGSLQVQLTTSDCGTQSGTVALSADMMLWKLEMNKSMLGPGIYGDTYTLTFMPEPFEVHCDGIVLPVVITNWFMPCTESTVNSDPELTTLWGNGTCGDMVMSWRLVRQ